MVGGQDCKPWKDFLSPVLVFATIPSVNRAHTNHGRRHKRWPTFTARRCGSTFRIRSKQADAQVAYIQADVNSPQAWVELAMVFPMGSRYTTTR